MKYLKQFYESFSFDDNDSILNDIDIDHEKLFNLRKRKIKHVKDYIFKSDNISVDKDILIDKNELIVYIRQAIKNFGKIESFFGSYRYKKINGSFSDFIFGYNNFIRTYGFYPKNITTDLISSLWKVYYDLVECHGGWISKHDESEKLYKEQEELLQKIKDLYNELENSIEKYNL